MSESRREGGRLDCLEKWAMTVMAMGVTSGMMVAGVVGGVVGEDEEEERN